MVHGIGLVPVTASFVGADLTSVASARAPVLFGGGSELGAFQVVKAFIRPSAAVTGHASNGVEIYLRNVGEDSTDTDDLSTDPGYSSLTGVDGTMAASVTVQLEVDGPASDNTVQKTYMTGVDNEGIEVFMAQAGTGIDLSAITFHVTLWLRLSRPSI